MKLYAISDLHLSFKRTRNVLDSIGTHPDDWLILAGDVCESAEQLECALDELGPRFAKLIWVPGNHELWSSPKKTQAPLGEAKYFQLVEICQKRGVTTPEDPYPIFENLDQDPPILRHVIAPLFLLYDYSFNPEGLGPEGALAWASESNIICADERYLTPTPYPSRQAWCAQRIAYTEDRLQRELDPALPTVLVNHWPLRADLAVLPSIPRFSIWCGTRASEDWHRKYRASCVVYGHLHIRRTRHRHGVRFEEVSLGYPRQYQAEGGLERYLRQILPAPGKDLLLRRHD